ncbi:MAG: integrin alpha [Nitrospinota bacterium]
MRPGSLLLYALLGAAAPLAAPLSAQATGGTLDQEYRFDGAGPTSELGYAAAGAGDVDGDGFADLIVGDPKASPSGIFMAGSAFVYSGATGGLILQLDGLAAFDDFGFSVAGAGDVDGDGLADLLVGAPAADPEGRTDAGSAFVFSGATGSLLYQVDGSAAGDALGSSVSAISDLDGDDFNDLLIGAPLADPNGLSKAGTAFVLSGNSGLPLWHLDGTAASDRFGASLSRAGDVDGDGQEDLLLGAGFASATGAAQAGAALVFSGATASQILRVDGQPADLGFGRAIALAGDLDGDGFSDFLVGAPFAVPGGLSDVGSAFLYSGATGGLLRRVDGLESSSWFGWSVAGPGDVDADGTPDLLVGAPFAAPNSSFIVGSAFVFSGASGDPIRRFDGDSRDLDLGFSVSGAGDVDADSRPDLIVGALNGSAFVFHFSPILFASEEVLWDAPDGRIDYTIDFPVEDAGAGYQVLLSAHGTGPTVWNGLTIPLQNDNLFRAAAHGNTPVQAVAFQGILDSQGDALAQIFLPLQALPLRLQGRRVALNLAVINSNFDFSSVARNLRLTQ